MTETAMTEDRPRRGRPPLGVQKERLQVLLDPDEAQAVRDTADEAGVPVAELLRDVVRAWLATRASKS